MQDFTQEPSYLNYIKECLTTKYITFRGRASRRELAAFMLFFVCSSPIIWYLSEVLLLLGMSEGLAHLFILVACLATYPPLVAVLVRRIHDFDLSGGTWIFGPVKCLFLCFQHGMQGDNKYGADPRQAEPKF